MAGKPREDRATIKSHFVGVRLTEVEWEGLSRYLETLDVSVSPAEIMRTALRMFLHGKKGKR